MSDLVDVASEQEEAFRAAALAFQARYAPHGAAAHECCDCGEEIPQARRRAVPGARRCIDCQERHERRERL